MSKTDIQIAREATPKKIYDIADNLGLQQDDIIPYGHYKAKVDLGIMDKRGKEKDGKVVLVTAVNPTPAGEGKTTTSVGLADGMSRIGVNVCLALREPSLGPVFGMKGGAAGGGYAQVIPMEDLNLHFTGDLHAITAANNLLSAMMDNHIYQGNELNIDIENITWRRCQDVNDRQLRNIECGFGKKSGVPRKGGFDITAASEVMAAFCLANSQEDLKERLGNIIIAFNMDKQPVYARDIKANGAMCVLLKDAFNPNLVQTLEHTPCFIHGGPFANIAHGCNSIVATKMAMKLADVVVTEAGFGADLGAEKFIDIKCRAGNIAADVVVLVATIRALKYHGGVAKDKLTQENVDAVKIGISNLKHHISNMQDKFCKKVVVAINKFTCDTVQEMQVVIDACNDLGVEVTTSDVWANGGDGGVDMAKAVMRALDEPSTEENTYLYDVEDTIENKVQAVCEYYGGSGAVYSDKAKSDIANIVAIGKDNLPICIAKTQYSTSDNMKLLGAPKGFDINIRGVKLNSGANFIVVISGSILRMPGLPRVPSANNIDIDNDGNIVGLF